MAGKLLNFSAASAAAFHAVGGGRALSQCGGQKWAGYLPGWWPMLVKGKYGIGIPRR
jgi:hypothetical protein